MGESFENYQSVFSWRYGSEEMREIWSEINTRKIWRKIWLILAQTQADFGLVTQDQVADLSDHVDDIEIEKALEIEKTIHHDLMAELKVYSGQCELGGGIIHMGATSVDIKDNATAIQIKSSIELLLVKLNQVINSFIELIRENLDTVTIGYTHLQPAEPVSLGYRFALYAQDLYEQYQELNRIKKEFRGKGMRGAVGSGASFAELIGIDNLSGFNQKLSERMGIPFYLLTNQTYPRLQEFQLLNCFAGIGAAIYRFAFDLRFLQNPSIGEWREPFQVHQVGSSAMPHKKNPVRSEKIDSLARLLAQYPRIAWDNSANSLLERTLDDSANRRVILPEACLVLDELLDSLDAIVQELEIDRQKIERNFAQYSPFMAIERVLMGLSKKGADRQKMHEILRKNAMTSWEAVQAGETNPLTDLIINNPAIREYLNVEEIKSLMNVSSYIGDSKTRVKEFLSKVEQ